jgi:hypothetical protein
VFHRSPTRAASWSWRAAEPPQGLCLPPDNGDLAEWHENLAGGLHALGEQGRRELCDYTVRSFDGGFLTAGTVVDGPRAYLAEGWEGRNAALHHLVFAALPDGHTCVRMEYAVTARRRVYLSGWEGVKLEIPNDVFMKGVRRYDRAGERITLEPWAGDPVVQETGSSWLNVDGRIGLVRIYGPEHWQILRRGRRVGGWSIGNVLTDVLCLGVCTEQCDVYGPATLLDNACLVLSSVDSETTRLIDEGGAARQLSCLRPAGGTDVCRAVMVTGRDDQDYVLAANFDDAASEVVMSVSGGVWLDLADAREVRASGGDIAVEIAAGTACLLKRVS